MELECALLDAGGQRRGEAAALALGGGGAIVGARGGGGDCVDHERAVFAGCPVCLGASVEAFSFLICLEAVPFVCNEGRICLAESDHPANSVHPAGRKVSPQAAAAMS